MKAAKWLTFVLASEELVIAGCYAYSHEWAKALYWLMAAALCAVVPFM